MKTTTNSGLGEPVREGKLALFQPPSGDENKNDQIFPPIKSDRKYQIQTPQRRIRTTIDLTSEALIVLQTVQQEYRLKTGRSLPIWRALSQVITEYAKTLNAK